MPHPLYAPTAYAVLGVVLLAVYIVYRAALPRPIAGIPYHRDSANRILGDAPGMIKHKQQYGTVFDWMTQQAVELNSPIFQLFLKPFSKPAVFITDPQEAQDILLRRAKTSIDPSSSRMFSAARCHTIMSFSLPMTISDTVAACLRIQWRPHFSTVSLLHCFINTL